MAGLEEVIGRNVRALRKARGGSQADLGKALAPMLGGQGWTRQAVWKAERGGRSFTAAELLALAAALGVTVPQLFETEGEPVTLPGGQMPAGVLVGLLAGSDESDRSQRLHNELRGLQRFNQQLYGLAAANTAQLLRLDAALNGAEEPEPETPRKKRTGPAGEIDAYFDMGFAKAKEWAQLPPKPESFPDLESAKETDR